MTRIFLLRAHPDPARRFADALVEAYAEGAHAGGHEVFILDLARMEVPALTSAAEWARPPEGEALLAAQAAIARAEHLVFVFPLWLGDMPAKLKAFLEQVSRNGAMVALDGQGHGGRGHRIAGSPARVRACL